MCDTIINEDKSKITKMSNDKLEQNVDSICDSGVESSSHKYTEHINRVDPGKDIDKGYAWVILVASCFSHAVFGFLLHGFSVLYTEIVQYFDASWADVGWIGSLSGAFFGCIGVFIGMAVERLGCRIACMLGGFMMCCGLVLSSFLVSVPYLYVTYGVLTGTFCGFSLLAGVVVVQKYFNKKRPLANGITTGFANIGGLMSGPLLRYLIDEYGLRGAILLEGGVMLQAVVCGACFKEIAPVGSQPSASKSRENLDGYVNKDQILLGDESTQGTTSDEMCHKQRKSVKLKGCLSKLFSVDMFRNRLFILYVVGVFIQATGITILYHHMINYAIFIGIEKTKSSFLVLILNVGIGVSAMSFGFLANLPGYNRMLQMALADIIAGVVIIIMIYTRSYPAMMVLVGIKGMLGGSLFAIETTNLADFVPLSKILPAQATMQTVFGLAVLIAVPFAGFLVDKTGSYTAALYCGSFLQAIASVFYLTIMFIQKQPQTHNSIHTEAQESNIDVR